MTIEESLARVQIESPHHGPIVAAEVTRLEARLASAERVVEAAKFYAGIPSCSAETKSRGMCHRDCVLYDALAAHSAAKEIKP